MPWSTKMSIILASVLPIKEKSMPQLLKNQNLELILDLPLENYHLPRFDWTGKIVDVKYKGITMAGIEKESTEPGDFPGVGFYNEFGIDKPIGYTDIQPGDWFHKIGVGLLQKTEGDYFFAHPYKIRSLQFKVEGRQEELTIHCEGPLVNGYAYSFEKKIVLTDQGFEIHYQLTNIGEKPIETNEYNHNFVRLGDQDIGGNYQLEFPFPLQPGASGEVVNPDQVVQVHENIIKLTGSPRSPFFYSFLNGEDEVPAQWKLIHSNLGIGIQETGSFSTSKVNLWAWRGAISPELFVPIHLLPGETKYWTRSYKIFELT